MRLCLARRQSTGGRRGRAGHRAPFKADQVLAETAEKLGISTESLQVSLFADLKDENRLLEFKDITADRLIDRYNVAIAQAVMLLSVRAEAEIRGDGLRGIANCCDRRSSTA